jgi:hypothetical protein
VLPPPDCVVVPLEQPAAASATAAAPTANMVKRFTVAVLPIVRPMS